MASLLGNGEARSPRGWPWAEPSVWTERMLTALEQGVKGGKSLNPILRGWFEYF
jgi:hypothetical protein